MLFFPIVASLCAATSVFAAPTKSVQDRSLLGGLLGGSATASASSLSSILSGLASNNIPLLASVQSIAGNDGLATLGNTLVNVTANADTNTVTLDGLDNLLAQLKTVLSAQEFDNIQSALDGLPAVNSNLFTTLQSLLTITSNLRAAQTKIGGITANTGILNSLASVLGSLPIVSNLQKLIYSLVDSLSSLSTLLDSANSSSGVNTAGLSSLTSLFSAIADANDSSITGIVSGSNNILGGGLIQKLLSGLGSLLSGLGLGSGLSGLTSIGNGLDLTQLASLLNQ